MLGSGIPADAGDRDICAIGWGQQSIDACSRYISKNPRDADAFYNRGLAWHSKRYFEKAIADYTKAIEINPKFAAAFYNRGSAWYDKGIRGKGSAFVIKAYKINPKKSLAYYTSALADFQKFAELDPNDSDGPRKIAEIEQKVAEIERIIASAAKSTTSVASRANATSTKRVALLIGNTNYKHQAALQNPANDVELIGRTLRSAGFSKVVIEKDLTREGIYSALNRFSKIAGRADFSLVHYAGHAIQVSGRNFIIPVDASLETDTQIDLQTIDANVVMAAISGSKKLRVLILDACRDNPFASQMKRMMSSRSISRGLAKMETVAGQLISFAAAAGQLADDGVGKHSPFAIALAKRISQNPPIEVRRLFDFVRDDVMQQTNKRQIPFTYHSLPARLDFYFNR
jgi:hypothetical protein